MRQPDLGILRAMPVSVGNRCRIALSETDHPAPEERRLRKDVDGPTGHESGLNGALLAAEQQHELMQGRGLFERIAPGVDPCGHVGGCFVHMGVVGAQPQGCECCHEGAAGAREVRAVMGGQRGEVSLRGCRDVVPVQAAVCGGKVEALGGVLADRHAGQEGATAEFFDLGEAFGADQRFQFEDVPLPDVTRILPGEDL